jgi:hypothetical protein
VIKEGKSGKNRGYVPGMRHNISCGGNNLATLLLRAGVDKRAFKISVGTFENFLKLCVQL